MIVRVRVCAAGGGWESVSYEVDETLPVIGFKALLVDCHEVFSEVNELRLLFKGRALGDDGTLGEAGVCDGAELHATMASRPAAGPSSPSGAPSDPPPKPETNLLSDRFVSSMLESPEMLATLHGAILNNPQMRGMLESNPDVAHALSDPNIFRQSLETARNPELMREQMRSTDRALSNIEAHPDGFNALRRMYSSVQQPLFDSLAGGGAGPPSPEHSPRHNTQGTPGVINTAALPNPWAPRRPAAAGGGALFGLGGGAGGAGAGGREDEERRRRGGR